MNATPADLKSGQLLPDFGLRSIDGRRVLISDYRGYRNLVLVFCGDPASDGCRPSLADLAQHYSEVTQEAAEVVAVVRGSIGEAATIKQRERLPFPVLADETGQAHRTAGAVTPEGEPAAAVVVTDRFGEVYAVYPTGSGDSIPTPDEILDWLRFIEIQCPE